jgi:hypothetical protein
LFAFRNNGSIAWKNCAAQIEITECVIQPVCTDIVLENPVQWLHELKAMTKDIAMSHNRARIRLGLRKPNLQFDFLPLM